MAGETTIQREIAGISEEISRIGKASRESNAELKQINQGLRLDPRNIELINQRFGVFRTQLDLSRQRTAELEKQIALLNSESAKQVYTDEERTNRLAQLNAELTKSEIQTNALTSAISKQGQVVARAKYTDVNRQLSQMQTLMGQTTTLMGLFGNVGEDSGNNVMKGMRQAMSGLQAVVGMMTLAQQVGNSTQGVFARLASTVTIGMGAFALGSTIINAFGKDARTVGTILAAVTPVIAGAAIAVMALKGALTLGIAIPIIMAAIGVGTAGILAAIRQGNPQAEVGTVTMATPSIPNIPTGNVGTTTTQNNTSQYNIRINVEGTNASPQDIANAVSRVLANRTEVRR